MLYNLNILWLSFDFLLFYQESLWLRIPKFTFFPSLFEERGGERGGEKREREIKMSVITKSRQKYTPILTPTLWKKIPLQTQNSPLSWFL